MGIADVETTNGFYSPIEKRIAEFKQEKASVNKWKEIIGKGDEATFTGVREWFDGMKPDQTLSKADIMNFMRDNRIEVVEVVKGEVSKQEKAEIQEKINAIYNKISTTPAPEIDAITEQLREINSRIERGEATDFDRDRRDLLEAKRTSLSNKLWAKEYAEIAELEQQKKREGGKFSQYQLSGEKENYKEVLVTMPEQTRPYTSKWDYYKSKGYTQEQFYELSDIEQHNLFVEWREISDKEQQIPVNNFRSSHFDEPNILVHLRMNTRTDSEGKKVLFLEEVQSDFGESYRKEDMAKNDYIDKNDLKVIEAFKKKGLLKIICPD